MKNTFENIITGLIIIMIICIFAGTIYFCLDVFGIIKVPAEYSIASLFYSKIEVIASSGENIYDDVIPSNIIFPENNVQRQEDTDNIEEVVAEPEDNGLQEIIDQINKNEEDKKASSQQIIPNQDVNFFYYEQLDTYGRIIYDKLYNHIDELKTGTYTADFGTDFNDLLHEENGEEVLKNSFQLAINALTFDNPELFYIDVTKMYLLTEITTRAFTKTYKVSIGGNGESYLADEFNSNESVSFAISNVFECRREIIDKCNGLDTISKIKIVHDYLVETIEYDSEAGNNIYNIYGALINRKAVCEGYARACKYILDEMDIPCIIACGVAKNNMGNTESHAWNYIQLDGKWYALDVTWDDPIIPANATLTKDKKYAYFLKGANEFFADHFEDGNIVGESNFKYPQLSVVDYKY